MLIIAKAQTARAFLIEFELEIIMAKIEIMLSITIFSSDL